MGSLLEEMHKMRLKEKIEELESIGGNPHVEDHGLGGVYRCRPACANRSILKMTTSA